MARATGVQISGSAVRVLDLEGSGKKYKVRGYAESAVATVEGEDRISALGKALKEAFKASKASREHVIVGIATRDCILREITIPFTNEDQIAKVIKFEAEPHLQQCRIDEVVIEFHKVADLGNRSTVLVVAVKKDLITDLLRALENQGIDPLSVDLDASGLFNFAKSHPETAELGNYVVCEVGYSSTMITLIKDGDLRIVRSIRLGTDSILSRVSRDLDIDRAEAKTRTQQILAEDIDVDEDLFVSRGEVEEIGSETAKTSSELERDIIRQRQTELVRRLRQEITRSLNPAKLEEPVEAIFIAGPGANLPRLKGELAEAMGLPVKKFEALEWLDHRFSAAEAEVFSPSMAVSGGLALKFIGEDRLEIDFRQEEFVFAKRFDRLKIPLLCLVFFLVALNVLWFFMNQKRKENIDYAVKNVGIQSASTFAEVMDPSKVRPDDLERYPAGYEEDKLKRIYLKQQQFAADGLQRINYMGGEVLKLRKKIRESYGLAEKKGGSRGGRGRRTGGGGSQKAYTDPSDYSSALENAEHVLRAIKDVGVRDFAITRFKATPTEVQFGIVLPNASPVRNGQGEKAFLAVLAGIEENLKKLPAEARFEELVDRSKYTPVDQAIYPNGPAVEYKLIVVSFAKEKI
jgi:type IV pilus assembly protein PilM